MDINQLDMFVRVATMKSFTKAAESMFLSQPTVSARMKGLELELGVQLFDRSRPRNLTLTEQGMLFWDYAQEILNLHGNALNKLKTSQGKSSGFLRIGAGSVPGTYILPEIIADFKKLHPEVKISLSVNDSSDVVSGVNSYSYDIGFVGYNEEDPLLEYVKIKEDELILITHPEISGSNDSSKKEFISLESLFEMSFILREPGSATRKVLEDNLNKKGYSFKDFLSVVYIDNLEGIKQAVRVGLGVSVVSRLSAEDYLNSGFIKGFNLKDIELNRSFYLVYNKNRVLNNVTNAFILFVRDNYLNK